MAQTSSGSEGYVAYRLDTIKLPWSVWWAERSIEFLLIPTALGLVTGAFHLHVMLTIGDWDFWLDWKDREWWITLWPPVTITFLGAFQYILWGNYRLPFGATLCIASLLLGEWLVRWSGWHMWSYYPINLVTPATLFAGAIAMDAILLLTRSFILTGIFGASLYALLFYPSNWSWLAAYHVPVEHNGLVMTVADLIGFEYIRTGTPEYIRIIERGTLRTFGQHSAPVSSFFAAFMCTLVYWMWWFIGKGFCTVRYIQGRL
uniref:AmoA-like protein n=1 Tax=uncultured prokaryote TaxID=198431 RepID=K7SJW6_9ZZZZ|nr:AmoA-like protein [uncultured prokaryote]